MENIMKPELVLESLKFIKGSQSNNIIVENSKHAEPLAKVLFESKVLFDLLHDKTVTLDKVVKQISEKNSAAKEYKKITGITWPF